MGIKQLSRYVSPLVLGVVAVALVAAVGGSVDTTTGIPKAISSVVTSFLPAGIFAVALYAMIQVIILKVSQKPWAGMAFLAIVAVSLVVGIVTYATQLVTSVPPLAL
jgi:hypothetical protein